MVYTYQGGEFDIDDLNETLARDFWQIFGDVFGSDTPALREAFNNWTDMLCKDGALCDDGYADCDLIYTMSESRFREWI